MTVPARSPVDDALDRLESNLWGYPAVREWIATVRSELERLQRHPDAWSQEAFDQQKARDEAAEAEVHRLREGLRWFADHGHELDDYEPTAKQVREKARALLAAPAGEHTEGEGGEA